MAVADVPRLDWTTYLFEYRDRMDTASYCRESSNRPQA